MFNFRFSYSVAPKIAAADVTICHWIYHQGEPESFGKISLEGHRQSGHLVKYKSLLLFAWTWAWEWTFLGLTFTKDCGFESDRWEGGAYFTRKKSTCLWWYIIVSVVITQFQRPAWWTINKVTNVASLGSIVAKGAKINRTFGHTVSKTWYELNAFRTVE